MTHHDDRPGTDGHARAAFIQEELTALSLAAKVRLIGLPVIAVWVTIENLFPNAFFYYGLLVALALTGWIPLAIRRRAPRAMWTRYAFPLLDLALIVFAVVYPNPLDDNTWPTAMRLRFDNENYLYLVIAMTAFSYSSRAVIVSGIGAVGFWTIGTLWIVSLPDHSLFVTDAAWETLPVDRQLAAFNDPYRVDLMALVRQGVIMLLITAVLATLVWRARLLVSREAEMERQRSNLSRYFSANMVEQLARSETDLSAVRGQDVAVLFVDIVGFSRMSEQAAPERIIDTLRQFHGRMERCVFAHGGTLDKYLGDGLMATFGTPAPGPRDATNALACGRAMLAACDDLNADRQDGGHAPLGIGVGVHFGPVVMGDIGGRQRLEFAVIGDTVNVASRLEALTRSLDTRLAVSGDMIQRVQAESGPDAVAGLSTAGRHRLPGRQSAVEVWIQPAHDCPPAPLPLS